MNWFVARRRSFAYESKRRVWPSKAVLMGTQRPFDVAVQPHEPVKG